MPAPRRRTFFPALPPAILDYKKPHTPINLSSYPGPHFPTGPHVPAGLPSPANHIPEAPRAPLPQRFGGGP